MRIDKDSYIDMINQLNIKAEELFLKGIINENVKNIVNDISKSVNNIDFESIDTNYKYSNNILNEIYNDKNIFKPLLSDNLENIDIDITKLNVGDIITDGEFSAKCIPYDILDNSLKTKSPNIPYDERKSKHGYYLNDIYNITNKDVNNKSIIKSFLIIPKIEENINE